MYRKYIITLVAITLVLICTSPVLAITYGEPDGNGHPYVGLALFYDESGNYLWRCSGTLLSSTVFLTAGHCTQGTASATVLFDSDLTKLQYPYLDCSPYSCVEGTPHTHPNYDDYATFPNTSDVGVVILDRQVIINKYGTLPKLGILDELATRRGHHDLIIRSVGYGMQSVKPISESNQIRYTSTSMLINLRSHLTDGYNLQTSNNPGQGHGTGGSCFGDSGGPIFYPQGSNVVVAVVSFGLNNNCKGADFGYRTDITNAQDFINMFLP